MPSSLRHWDWLRKKKVDWIWHRPKPAIGNPSTHALKLAASTLKQKENKNEGSNFKQIEIIFAAQVTSP